MNLHFFLYFVSIFLWLSALVLSFVGETKQEERYRDREKEKKAKTYVDLRIYEA